MRARLCLIASALILAAATPGKGANADGRASDPSYTDAQAATGSQVYAERCAMCHGRSLEGTVEVPALTGRFVANWAGRPVGDLQDYIGHAMPQFAPGSLVPEETSALVAFVLKSNGYPAGMRPLPADIATLRQVMLPPPGPAR